MFRPVIRAITVAPLAAVLLGPVLPAAAGTARRAAARVLPQLESQYVRMPDGVRLAVDVWLPPGTTAGARLPTVLETDRYWRARAYTGGIKHNPNYFQAQPWNQRGYAYVFADLRGTGDSFGTLTAELGRAMIKDVGSLWSGEPGPRRYGRRAGGCVPSLRCGISRSATSGSSI
jgi:uncharacterized protein